MKRHGTPEGRERCPRCQHLSYSWGSFGWCPWCDKEAPTPTARLRGLLIAGSEFLVRA